MTIDNKPTKDRTKKLKEFKTYKWVESQFIEHIKSITHGAATDVHEISLEDGDKIYLVPQDFYEQAKIAIKKSNQDKEQKA